LALVMLVAFASIFPSVGERRDPIFWTSLSDGSQTTHPTEAQAILNSERSLAQLTAGRWQVAKFHWGDPVGAPGPQLSQSRRIVAAVKVAHPPRIERVERRHSDFHARAPPATTV